MTESQPRALERPLSGKRILVTRAAHQAPALRALLEGIGASVAEIPVIEIMPPASYVSLDEALARIGDYDWLLVTSVNGAEALFARLAAVGLAPEALRQLQICAIGPATRAALVQGGLQVAVMPERYIAEAVVEALRSQAAGKRLLLVRAAVARDVIPRELQQAGAIVNVVEAYRTTIPAGSAERLRSLLSNPTQRPHVITFTSSSTVRNLAEMLGGGDSAARALHGIALASIGPVTSATLRQFGLPPHIEAAAYTMPGLAEAITKYLASRATSC